MGIAKFEEKFIVINKKHLDALRAKGKTMRGAVDRLLEDIKTVCILSPEIESNKYIVCNQDETYAPRVLAIILQYEDLKEANRICKKNSAKNYKGR